MTHIDLAAHPDGRISIDLSISNDDMYGFRHKEVCYGNLNVARQIKFHLGPVEIKEKSMAKIISPITAVW